MSRASMNRPAAALAAALATCCAAAAAVPARAQDYPFDDQLFRRCVGWMLSGKGGALIENLCIADYDMPAPSLFLCARKTLAGFESEAEREGCAVIFDEQAKRTREGRVR